MLYLLRLDDASEYMNIKKWQEMESLLDRHGIRPIVGVIPHNLDPSLVNKFEYNQSFGICNKLEAKVGPLLCTAIMCTRPLAGAKSCE